MARGNRMTLHHCAALCILARKIDAMPEQASIVDKAIVFGVTVKNLRTFLGTQPVPEWEKEEKKWLAEHGMNAPQIIRSYWGRSYVTETYNPDEEEIKLFNRLFRSE